MGKKRIVIVAAIAILLANAVCILPWPTRIDLQMTGVEVSADGAALHDCTVQLQGWKLNYLFRQDTVRLDTFQIDAPSSLDLQGVYHATLISIPSNECDYVSWLSYSEDWIPVHMYLDKDNEWLVTEVADRHFVAHINAGADYQTYWNACKEIIK